MEKQLRIGAVVKYQRVIKLGLHTPSDSSSPSSIRWPSFRNSDHLNQPASSLQISSQSAGQLSLLQKFSLLRLTAIMEKYSMSNKHGWTWLVHQIFSSCSANRSAHCIFRF